ncbi:MAG: SMP-30/gluconolactonase/LRE family protein [Planctomycetota bacterium]|jgi:sugar lactone lactonase YvrE|nr:SMP-30/gluconolactonase/LRE family protein [Planctomycetota bacterium]
MVKRVPLLCLALSFCAAFACVSADKLKYNVPRHLQVSRLFVSLPGDIVATPDGMAIASNGDLVVACPNFGNQDLPGAVIRVDRHGNVRKWFDVPVNGTSGVARPMGIDFDDEGNLYIVDNQGWTGNPESVNQGRIIKAEFDRLDNPVKFTEIAVGMEHPNGIKYRDGYLYVTQSSLEKVEDPSGKLVSCVYRFPADAKGIKVANTLADKWILLTVITENPEIQYGLDGLVFDKKGNLYLGNFGDGAIHKVTFNRDGGVKDEYVWAKDTSQLMTTDGMCMDPEGNIYVADFSPNAIARIDRNGDIKRIAMSPDSDGARGELDQPGEPIYWNGKLHVTCFDMVTDDGKVNAGHQPPHTIVCIDL